MATDERAAPRRDLHLYGEAISVDGKRIDPLDFYKAPPPDWHPIATAPKDGSEFIVLLPDGTVRTAAWGLGTILLGAYGTAPRPEQWPTRWTDLPTPPEGS
jgi:hypothetical protein